MNGQCHSEELLHRCGLDSTPHRRQVLKVFESAQNVLTPQMILREIRRQHPIDKVTLYRILELFVKKGIVRRLTVERGPQRYEIICEVHAPRHPHFVCRECGEMECLEDIDIKGIRNSVIKGRDFQQVDIDLKLEGKCAKCSRMM